MRIILSLAVWLYVCDSSMNAVRGFMEGVSRVNSCAEIARKLIDPSREVRERSAREFATCRQKPGEWVSVTDFSIAEHLRDSVKMGNSAADTLFMIGGTMDVRSRDLLEERQRSAQGNVRFTPDSPEVSERLAAMIARLKQGANVVRPDVLKLVENASVEEAQFLLDALYYLDDRQVLQAITKFLVDTRPLTNGRRVCDYAVSALQPKLRLRLSFSANRDTYSDAQLEEARKAAAGKVK